ncbi:Proteolipid membrane potential modulator [Kalmanozyma brasiliensis GHG001]|uniref:Stress response RCI peptide n=1 Tax=Kalmanozyma brasiliensis (strain GHG001) TaxID=1365824 RepID=V5EQ75_KALBG|nr:Proteolipid membrane potential modulator [Kalmanozyma brasiliensis GHG001]EST05068.1 Proteolipid membrane potential modulator [Kalmanozyma brasiliensis GHG001]
MSKLLRNGIPRKEDGKIDFSWKNHYGFTGLLVVLGFLFPPLAVATRFGIGRDFFINVLLTCCAFIPGHIHNWFIQNIRNNDTAARTPKWAIRYGLVDDRPAKKLQKKRAWTGQYNDRLPPSQRVVYDDEGNAHVVEAERDNSRDDVTAPWNVHSTSEVRPQKTGLVEPDQYINEDPSQPQMSYDHALPSKQSKLSIFNGRGHRHTESNDWVPTQSHGHTRRRSSLSSTTSSLSINTPEDPYRSTFPSRPSGRNNSGKAEPMGAASPVVVSSAPRREREDDIFDHQF